MDALKVVAFVLTALVWSAASSAAGELKVGDAAPDFTLQASDGKTYRLSDFRGKQAVVLAWFPKAYTRGCTLECKSLAQHGDLLKKYDVTYFMMSVDPLEHSKSFAAQEHADFPLLSDSTKQTANAYGVLGMLRIANRWTFYIGRDGKIQAIDKDVKPATSADDMAATLHRLAVPVR
ncbi:MAG TPA: peroxiredoxin [Vicinamibacterales bacterium]|nr:peroxiredoxin [Vicinamibacterales bacterium]